MKGVMVLLLAGVLSLGQHGDCGENVALRREAVQSSRYGSGYASLAVDGDRNGDYFAGFCSHTDGETNPWWRVDLRGEYKVSALIIANREDSLSERINGAEIRIGSSLENDGNDNPLCAVISTIAPGEPGRFVCDGMVGRYVNVRLPGYNRFLTLCEVEVFAVPAEDIIPPSTLVPSTTVTLTENVALGKKARQSSTRSRGFAGRATDGRRNTWFREGSCTQTRTETDPWWRVDLLRVYNVTSVTITSRDDCCAEMIDGAEIRIGSSLENNGNSNPRCAVISSSPAWETLTFQCHEMEGRYVNIFLPGCHKFLTLCEVEVNAQPAPASTPPLAVITETPPLVPEQDFSPELDEEIFSFFKYFMKGMTEVLSTAEHELLVMVEEEQVKKHEDGQRSGQCPDRMIAQENAATGGIADQSTQWDSFGDAGNAIDRKREAVYLSGSCSHTKAEANPWWRVDLRRPHNVSSVAVTNREECCSDRIDGAQIRVGNSVENGGTDNPVCAVVPYIPAGQTRSYQCHGMEGRYVTIVLPGTGRYLTLCEVEVIGKATTNA